MLNRDDECKWLDVYRYCRGARVSDQRLRVQSEKLERRFLVAAGWYRINRDVDLHGQAVGELVALSSQRVRQAGAD